MVQNKRREDRVPATGAIMVARESGFVSGLASNISSTGLCAYVQGRFSTDEPVSVYSSTFGTRGPRQGSVRWCSRVSQDLYMVGLSFINSSQRPHP